MADAKQCDRCGKFYIKNHIKYHQEVIESCDFQGPHNKIIRKFDLCDECVTGLLNFFGLQTDSVITKSYENESEVRWRSVLKALTRISDDNKTAGDYIKECLNDELSAAEKGVLIYIFGETDKYGVKEDGTIFLRNERCDKDVEKR